MAFLARDSRTKRAWMIVWHDWTRGDGRLARRKASCATGDHREAFQAARFSVEEWAALARGARNDAQRAKLLTAYQALERQKKEDAARVAGSGVAPAFDTPLGELLGAYLSLIRHRVALRGSDETPGPLADDPGWKVGRLMRPLAPSSGREVERTVKLFREWLPRGLTSGQFTGDVLADFIAFVAAGRDRETTTDADKEKPPRRRSARSVNKFRAHVREFINSFRDSALRRYFRGAPERMFAGEVEALPEPASEVVVCSPAEIAAFLEAADDYCDPDRVVDVKRRRNGKDERFEQAAATTAPIKPLLLVLATTGMRLGEALRLRWRDVNLEAGVIRIYAQKTGVVRHLPLVSDPSGDISPGLLELLRAWRAVRPKHEFVLEGNGKDGQPVFPKHAWHRVQKLASVDLGPQALRRTFLSALAAIGFGSRLSALLLGHGEAVSAKHYAGFIQGRCPGATVDEVLGLTSVLEAEAEAVRASAPIRLLRASGE